MSDVSTAIDATLQTADVGKRLRGQTPHEIVCDLKPASLSSRIMLDGLDISGMIRAVRVESEVGELTRVALDVAPGQIAKLRALLPEAQCVLDVSAPVVEVALVEAMREICGNGPLVLKDVPTLARKLLDRFGATP